MASESPVSVLFNTNGTELAVTASHSASFEDGAAAGLLAMGSGSNGAQFFTIKDDGSLFVSGNIASIASPVTVKQLGCTTTLVTGFNADTNNVTVLPANSSRCGAIFFMDGIATAFVKFGSVASSTSFTIRLTNGDYYEVPSNYTGQIDVVFTVSAPGATLRITEIRE